MIIDAHSYFGLNIDPVVCIEYPHSPHMSKKRVADAQMTLTRLQVYITAICSATPSHPHIVTHTRALPCVRARSLTLPLLTHRHDTSHDSHDSHDPQEAEQEYIKAQFDFYDYSKSGMIARHLAQKVLN